MTGEWFVRRAAEVGPETRRLVEGVPGSHPVEPQGYVPCSNILSLSKRGRSAELESACAKINGPGGTATHARVKNTMAALRDASAAAGEPSPVPAAQQADRAAHAGRVSGAEHWRRDKGGRDA